jgi:hypothetical protein
MATMSMNKAIHGAFRRDLARFETALQRFPAGNAGRARDLVRAWDNFDHQLVRHHTGEHEIAWPHLQRLGLSRDLLDRMDAEHYLMAAALAEARTAVRALPGSPTAGTAETALAKVRHLRDTAVQHLDHEEGEIEQFYLDHEDSAEMKAMGKAFAKEGGVSEGGRFFEWILDGATPAERAAVTHGIPGPVLKVLTGVFGRGYRKEVAPVWRS